MASERMTCPECGGRKHPTEEVDIGVGVQVGYPCMGATVPIGTICDGCCPGCSGTGEVEKHHGE